MTDDHMPLTRSLEVDVRAAFLTPNRGEGLSREALIAQLATLSPAHQSLDDAIYEASGGSAAGADDVAVLNWIDAVFMHWFRTYALDEQLQVAISDLRPLAAAFALQEERFFIPAGHAIHRLLDTLAQGFLGWQHRFADQGPDIITAVSALVAEARQDFPSEPAVDNTLNKLKDMIANHHTQLQQLGEGVIERERVALGNAVAQLHAALSINELLEAHEVPGSVARFLKSDWFESGSLIVERFGLKSDEWRDYLASSQLLVDAVQPVSLDDSGGQNRLQTAMQQLPNTLARQLLSLQPDHDAVAGAVGLIEYALLRNIRGEDLGLLQAEPISVRGMPEDGLPTEGDLLDEGIEENTWFQLEIPEGEERLLYIGSVASQTQLVFINFLGARGNRLGFTEFKALLHSGEARPLVMEDTFCRAMREATDSGLKQRETREAELKEELAVAAVRAAEEQEERDRIQAQKAQALADSEARAQAARRGEAPPDLTEPPPAPLQTAPQEVTRTEPRREQVPATDQPFDRQTIVKLQIPMGTWMGFHDREPPMMAQVAVRDLERDTYIFTNREGIKLRELTVNQLISLIDRNMVDILERKTNFREAIQTLGRNDTNRLSQQS